MELGPDQYHTQGKVFDPAIFLNAKCKLNVLNVYIAKCAYYRLKVWGL